MFLLYLDASGTSTERTHVIAGVCVHEGNWFALENRVKGLKARYGLAPGVEIHAKDFCCSYTEQNDISDFESRNWSDRRREMEGLWSEKLKNCQADKRASLRKRYNAQRNFFHLTRRERSQLFESALDLIGGHQEIRLFGYINEKQGHPDYVINGFTQVVSRFDHFLKWYNNTLPRGQIDNGMLFLDQDQTHESAMAGLIKQFREQGHPWGTLDHVMEIPVFADSKAVHAIQLADVVAYALRRYVEHATVADSFEEKNFLRIYHKFDRGAGKLHGLRHYHPGMSCNCVICIDTGHASQAT